MARERTPRTGLRLEGRVRPAVGDPQVVIHIVTGLGTGGAEMMLFKLLTAMGASPFRPIVISLGDRGTIGSRIEELGVPLYALGLRRGNPSAAGLWRLRSLLRQAQPALIQGWMYHGNLAASIARLLSRTWPPVLWNIRQSLDHLPHERTSTRTVIRAGAMLSRLPQRIIYNSRRSAVQHAANGYFAERSVVIPNGFDCEIFKPSPEARLRLRQELGVGADIILIGLIARFHPMKDHETFFRAAALLSSHYPYVHYILAGHRVEVGNAELQSMLEAAGVAGKAHLLGERCDIPAITAALDIASLSSSSEAFPNVIGEAMASGIPCVVTDTGDAASLVGDTTAPIPVGNAKALAAGWAELIEGGAETRRAIGRRGRQRILTEFSLSRVAGEYVNLYKELLIVKTG